MPSCLITKHFQPCFFCQISHGKNLSLIFLVFNITTFIVFSLLFSAFNITKGQLISKCPFGVKTSSKKPTKLFPGFCPEIVCTFQGASRKLFWASCRLLYLWYYLLSPQEAQKASRKPPGRCKKNQGRNPEIITLVFWKKFWHQKDILKLTDL